MVRYLFVNVLNLVFGNFLILKRGGRDRRSFIFMDSFISVVIL